MKHGSFPQAGPVRHGWPDLAVTVVILSAAALVSFSLQPFTTTDFHVPLIFTFATFLISYCTKGYFYGILASVFSVFAVNYAFTYPYFALNFSLPGYALTFALTLAVSVLTCALTSKVRQGEELRLAAERQTMRANLLRSISHDFRTPLTSIVGSINVIREDAGELTAEEKDSLLLGAKTDAEWLINMVENLLSITRMEGGAVLHKEQQIVDEVLEDVVAKFRRQYPHVTLSVNLPEEPLLVPMDIVLIEQVLLNFLVNAIVHGKTTTEITLSVERQGDQARFTVSDNGQGIRSELLPLLFHSTISHQMEGDQTRNMGIGLTVCSDIVKAHGGTIEAKNNPAGGASFSFTLPLGEQELPAELEV